MMLAVSSTSMWYTMRASGIVALVLLSATMILGILTAGRLKAPRWPGFAQGDLHKRVSVLAMVFLSLHVLTAVLDTYVHIGWLAVVVPFASSYRPLWVGLGTVGVDLILALAISGALRQRISARAWRGIHWVAYASWPVAMAHSLGMGTDASALWLDALAGICAFGVVGSLVWRINEAQKGRRVMAAQGAGRSITTGVAPSLDRRLAVRASHAAVAPAMPGVGPPDTHATARSSSDLKGRSHDQSHN